MNCSVTSHLRPSIYEINVTYGLAGVFWEGNSNWEIFLIVEYL